jgi:hypothetical protein
MKKGITFAAAMLAATIAYADAPKTVLIGATITLTTNTFPTDAPASSYTAWGMVQTNMPQTTAVVAVPCTKLHGYIERSASDKPIDWVSPRSATRWKSDKILFWPEDSLVLLKHPTTILVSTGSLAALRLPLQIVQRIAKRPATFDGYKSYRQPFYMPQAHAECLANMPPHFQCGAKYTYNGIWISCNSEVGEKELGPICARDYAHRPTEQEVDAVASKPNVFFITLADE